MTTTMHRLLATAERPAWAERPRASTQGAKSGGIVVILALILLPLYMIVLTSLSTQAAINAAGGMVIWPHGLSLGAYRDVVSGGVVSRALLISLGVTAVGTAFSMFVTILAAYGMSRAGSFGHRTILWIMMTTMFFNGGIIPLFLVVSALGGYDQYWALIAPSAVSVFNIIVMRSFFASTAQDLIDSARIDGAGEWQILWRVVLPTSRAVTAVIALFYAVGYWNDFFTALLYLNNSAMWPLSLVLRLRGGQSAPVPSAAIVVAILPIVAVYPFLQRYFTRGVLSGAVKG